MGRTGRAIRNSHAGRMHRNGATRLGMALAAGVLLLMAGSAVAQEETADSACRDECVEARKICRRGAKSVFWGCRANCREAIWRAAGGARAICAAEELGERACESLVRKAVAGATEGCHAECRVGRLFRGVVCEAERKECRQTCLGVLDPECRSSCREDLAACGEELRACSDGCRDAAREGRLACRELVAESCDPGVFRDCLDQVRDDLRMCVNDCHDEQSCAGDLRTCLGECPRIDE